MNNSKEKTIPFKVSGWITLIASILVFLYCSLNAYEYFSRIATSTTENLSILSVIKHILLVIVVPLAIQGGNNSLKPNEATVYTFMGNYMGTLRGPGYFAVPPWWGSHDERDLAIKTVRIGPLMVNEKGGNPIIIGCDIFCNEEDTYAATFDVSDLDEYLNSKGEVALRKLAMSHPMDTIEDDNQNQICLMSNVEKITQELETEIKTAYEKAGYQVDSAAITALNYAPEIAGVMLQKQSAKATLGARTLIAKGAVGIIKDATTQLETEASIKLSEQNKQRLALSLLVTLCSTQPTSPVLDIIPRASNGKGTKADAVVDEDDDE